MAPVAPVAPESEGEGRVRVRVRVRVRTAVTAGAAANRTRVWSREHVSSPESARWYSAATLTTCTPGRRPTHPSRDMNGDDHVTFIRSLTLRGINPSRSSGKPVPVRTTMPVYPHPHEPPCPPRMSHRSPCCFIPSGAVIDDTRPSLIAGPPSTGPVPGCGPGTPGVPRTIRWRHGHPDAARARDGLHTTLAGAAWSLTAYPDPFASSSSCPVPSPSGGEGAAP